MSPRAFVYFPLICAALCVGVVQPIGADEPPAQVRLFLEQFCADCHLDGAAEGGLAIEELGFDLQDEAVFSNWERIFDRVEQQEMPPRDAESPTESERHLFGLAMKPILADAHSQRRGTVLRRLNRREYENTMNDIFGTNLGLEDMLPEDGRSSEFDNVGDALGVSMVHLQRYMDAANVVLDTAIARTVEAPEPSLIQASYLETREAERFIGKVWKELEDGAVVRFSGGGYPSGMMRGTGVRNPGRYRVRVSGYGYQTDRPIVFSVGGTSFARGSEKPIYGYWSFDPGKNGSSYSIEFETWIEKNYMIEIEPFGISDPNRYQRDSIADYDGPGLAILNVTLEGPLLDQFPSRGHRLLFDGLERTEIPPRNPNDRTKSWYQPKFEISSSNERRDALTSIERVASSAFRKPVDADELEPYLLLFDSQRSKGASFEEALRVAVKAIFCSPRFLYLDEGQGRLDDYALAARLSYFLTRTAPDDELLAKASAGELASNDDVLREQTERLLNDDRSQRFIADFCDSWLDLRQMDFTAPDSSLFPEYDLYLRYSMPIETLAFLAELIDSNLPTRSIVKSDFAIVNDRLADHYGLSGIQGVAFRKVSLPVDSLRGGFLGQASVLKVTANGTNTSPVVRGAWVMERFIGETPAPPPPGIPGVEPDIRGALTLRDLLEKHRDVDTCNACHRKIDPPGFALEVFNPIGGHRDRYRSLGEGERIELQVRGRNVRYRLGADVDCSGEMPDGNSFTEFQEFRELLARDEEMLTETLATKLLTFATGREMGFSDRDEIDRIVELSKQHNHGVRDLLHSIVQSEIFRNK